MADWFNSGSMPPGMVSYSGEPPHLPYNLNLPTGGAPAGSQSMSGSISPDQMLQQYQQIKANSTYMPGLGYIPNANMQGDSRGNWITPGSGPAQGMGTPGTGAPGSSNPMSNDFTMPAAPSMGSGYGNPNQGALDQSITQGWTNTLMNDWLPAIQSQSVGSGSLGGTRQAVAQAGAIGQAGQGLASALAGSHYGQYNQDQNRNLQRYQADQGYNLGLGGLNLGYQNGRNSFYLGNRGLDQSGAQVGANIYDLSQRGQWTPFQQYTNTLSPWSGFGNTTTSGQQGGGWQGAVGGGLAGLSFAKQMGWV